MAKSIARYSAKQRLGEKSVQVTNPWRHWVAENLLLDVSPRAIVEAMLREGIDRQAALREVQVALEHPYLAAAREARGVDPVGGSREAKVKKRDWVLECYRRNAHQSSQNGRVPRVHKPSRQNFLDNYYALNRPVLIEGALADWPALTRWTPTYLKERAGDRTVEVQANRNADALYELNSPRLKQEMRFGDYVDLVESVGSTNDFYITANNTGRNAEALAALWEDVPLLEEYLEPRGNGAPGFFWYGPAGTVTPLHHDLTNNFMAQVRGHKLVRLIAPYELAHMYNHRHCFSEVDLDRVDHARFPLFKDVQVVDVEIGPGDLLFLPVGWWHYVRGLSVSITTSFTSFVFDNDFNSFYTTYDAI